MIKGKKLGVIGMGKLGEALVKGMLKQGKVRYEDIYGSDVRKKTLTRVHETLGIKVMRDNKSLARQSDIIILAVKPQDMVKVLREIANVITSQQLIVSNVSSATTGFIEEHLTEKVPVVRSMPNIACAVNRSMTVLSPGHYAKKKHMKIAEIIYKSVGETVFLKESLMDGVTGLSASGPAFIYVVIESMAEAGVKLGIPRDISTVLVAQTLLGTARLVLESKEHPALLKEDVTTPAGCTVDGLLELEEGKLRVTLIKAVVKTAERAKELVLTQDQENQIVL